MGYITLKQASEKWNISERRIRRLIQEGRIEGAEKIGNAWNIPEEANKPIDRRYKIDEDNFIINSYIEDDIYNIDKQLLKLNKEKPIYISKNINMKELSKDNKYLIIKEEVNESDIFNKKFFTL